VGGDAEQQREARVAVPGRAGLGNEPVGGGDALLMLGGELPVDGDAGRGNGKDEQGRQDGGGAPASMAVHPDAGVQEGSGSRVECDLVDV
jgi:hypothetical protein